MSYRAITSIYEQVSYELHKKLSELRLLFCLREQRLLVHQHGNLANFNLAYPPPLSRHPSNVRRLVEQVFHVMHWLVCLLRMKLFTAARNVEVRNAVIVRGGVEITEDANPPSTNSQLVKNF